MIEENGGGLMSWIMFNFGGEIFMEGFVPQLILPDCFYISMFYCVRACVRACSWLTTGHCGPSLCWVMSCEQMQRATWVVTDPTNQWQQTRARGDSEGSDSHAILHYEVFLFASLHASNRLLHGWNLFYSNASHRKSLRSFLQRHADPLPTPQHPAKGVAMERSAKELFLNFMIVLITVLLMWLLVKTYQDWSLVEMKERRPRSRDNESGSPA